MPESQSSNKRFEEYLAKFETYSDEDLIATFNGDAGNPGWVSARGEFHAALRSEFNRRGFDTSALKSGNSFSLARKVRLVGKRLEPLEQLEG